ncbi:MAG: hypothetical protein WA941_18420 [Nitrososphaeraceae archaeon]
MRPTSVFFLPNRNTIYSRTPRDHRTTRTTRTTRTNTELQTIQRPGSNSGALEPGDVVRSTANCLPGEIVTGEGLQVNDGKNTLNPEYVDRADGDANPTSWVVEYQNLGPNTVSVQPFAVCGQLVPFVP